MFVIIFQFIHYAKDYALFLCEESKKVLFSFSESNYENSLSLFFPAFSHPLAITVMLVAWKNIKRSLFLFIEIYLSLFPSLFSEFRSKWKLFLIMILLIFEGRYFANFYTGKAAKEANDVLQAKNESIPEICLAFSTKKETRNSLSKNRNFLLRVHWINSERD